MYTKNRKRKLSVRAPFLAIGVAGAISLAASVASAQDRCYSTIDLGVIDTDTPEKPFGINNQNQAVFSVNVGGGTPKFHAMLYLPTPAYGFSEPGLYDLHDLANIPEAESSVAHDINENGIVVGYRTFNGKRHAYIWQLDSDPHEFIDMGIFPGGDWSEAFAINDEQPNPWIVGEGRYLGDCACNGGSSLLQLAFAITLDLADNGLGTGEAATLIADPSLYHLPDCHRNTTAFDVNTALILKVAGNSMSFGSCSEGTTRATTWTDPILGIANDGAKLTLLDVDVPRSLAKGISNLGPIVGSSTTSEAFQSHAVYWDIAGGPIVDLGSILPTNPRSNALRINNLADRDVVGNASIYGLSPFYDGAALWVCSINCGLIVGDNWTVTSLGNALTTQTCSDYWRLKDAYDVNDTGHIIAWGGHNSAWHAVILVPREPCCPADLDGDGTVGTNDLLILFATIVITPFHRSRALPTWTIAVQLARKIY